jgi:hypothetical protein
MPYAWSSTNQPRLCSCPKPTSLAWECTRCGKINAPWKGSCDCGPTPFGAPTSNAQPFNERVNPFIGYFPDTNKNINQDHVDLNKNFTDK